MNGRLALIVISAIAVTIIQQAACESQKAAVAAQQPEDGDVEKRRFYQWAGKRGEEDDGDHEMSKRKFYQWAGKRAQYKRRFYAWAGKRSVPDEESMGHQQEKRKFY